jgi:fructosamine-3-kinase
VTGQPLPPGEPGQGAAEGVGRLAAAEVRVGQLAGAEVREVRQIGGQHRCGHYRAVLADGRQAFVKMAGPRPDPELGAAFEAEARGLRWLAEAQAVPVPDVLGWDVGGLAVAWVPGGPPDAAAAERFGRDLAGLHRSGAARLGAPWPGFIASLPLGNDDAPGDGTAGQSGDGEVGQSGEGEVGQSGEAARSGEGEAGRSGECEAGRSGEGEVGQSGEAARSGEGEAGRSGECEAGRSGEGEVGQSGEAARSGEAGQSGDGAAAQSGDRWPQWYAGQRLLPYVRLAYDAGELGPADVRLLEQVASRAAALAGPAEPPSRIHGDCWSGNVLWSGGRGWLIDPAAHGGHRESDLAMLALFGAPYLDRIMAAYQEAAPLAPGWRARVPLHQLHPLLVHVCLFGAAYRDAALGAARAALAAD